jgi:ribosomal protein S2
MKIKNIIKKQNKLFQLKLIQTKIYKKSDSFSIANLKIRDIEYRLKKGLQIIYTYHLYNKKILFIGNSSTIKIKLRELLKNTKHTFITNYLWLNGIITNKQQ